MALLENESLLQSIDFGEDFKFGVSTAAYQIEGAHNIDGKGRSIWDEFSNKKSKIFKNQNGNIACDHYNRWKEDIELLKALNIKNYRFSISWPRILPLGTGQINQAGIDYYNSFIDALLDAGIEPWVTCYHWDLPLALERKGGWTNREIISWFEEYVDLISKAFGDRVKYWMVLNEPMVFTGAGYFMGIHAPGKKGLKNFLPAVHHAVLAQSAGGRVLRYNCPNAQIGTTFSCSQIIARSNRYSDKKAAVRADAMLNRLFIEPSLGLGYPTHRFNYLETMYRYFRANDAKKMPFSFDFIGIQNYTREVIKHCWYVPYVQAKIVSAQKRKVPFTSMGWEVYPESIYQMLKQFSSYVGVKKIIVTENGAAFPDKMEGGKINDELRLNYLKSYLAQVYRAKREEIPVEGYFIWTLMDNFEWAEGYAPRFGIVHNNFETQKRTIKLSGYWIQEFLKSAVLKENE